MADKTGLGKKDIRNCPRKGQRKTANQMITLDFSAYTNSRELSCCE